MDEVADEPLQCAEGIQTADRVSGMLQEGLEQGQLDTLCELGGVHPGGSDAFVSEVFREIFGDIGGDVSAEVVHVPLDLQPEL